MRLLAKVLISVLALAVVLELVLEVLEWFATHHH